MPFKKGKSGNPKGRPRKGNSALEALEKAIKTVEKRKKKKLFALFVEKAYEDEKVLIALIKKVLPDLRHYEHEHELTDKTTMEIVAMLLNKGEK